MDPYATYLTGIVADDPDAYVSLIRRLPTPTVRQTALFASYIAEAHSWYKHLPSSGKKVPFLAFLDPHAGECIMHDSEGRTMISPIEDTKGHIHYTAQTTTDYRRRFGFWNYGAEYGTTLIYRVKDKVVDTRSQGPRVVGERGKWIPVPEYLLELGRAEVDIFVHSYAASHFKALSKVVDPLRERIQTIESMPPVAIDLPALPDDLMKTISTYERSYNLWEDDLRIDSLVNSLKSSCGDLYPDVLEHLETAPCLNTDNFTAFCARKRLSRLRALKAAMYRVVESVYG